MMCDLHTCAYECLWWVSLVGGAELACFSWLDCEGLTCDLPFLRPCPMVPVLWSLSYGFLFSYSLLWVVVRPTCGGETAVFYFLKLLMSAGIVSGLMQAGSQSLLEVFFGR